MVLPPEAEFKMGMYSVKEGKWIDATKKPLDAKAVGKFLNKGGVLKISATEFDKKGPAEADTITFPKINARPKVKLAVNYSFGESEAAGLGTWTLAKIVDKKHAVSDKLVAIKPAAKKPTPAELVTFGAFEPQAVLDNKDNAKANRWFVKENAVKISDSEFTPSSKMKAFAGKPAGKVPFKTLPSGLKEGDELLKLNTKWVYTLDGGAVNEVDAKTMTNLAAGVYIFWIPATEKKAPSLRSIFTVAAAD